MVRHMARCCPASDAGLDRLCQIRIKAGTGGHAHEQDHPNVIVPGLAHDKSFLDLVESLDLAIDFGGADAHPAGVQRRVRPAMDDDAATLGQRGPVTMPPDAVEMFEIGGAVFAIPRIVPELDRHRRKGLQAAELALFAGDGLAVLVKDVDRHAKAACLNLAGMNRLRRAAKDKAGDQVGAAGNGAELQISVDLVIDELERLGGERRSGRHHHAHR